MFSNDGVLHFFVLFLFSLWSIFPLFNLGLPLFVIVHMGQLVLIFFPVICNQLMFGLQHNFRMFWTLIHLDDKVVLQEERDINGPNIIRCD